MSSTTTNAGEAATAGQGDSLVSVRVDELIVGRGLSFPVYDHSGVLLLAEGSLITADVKRLLKQRGEGSILVDAADANRIRISLGNSETQPGLMLDEETTNRLDRLVDQGLLSVENTGPAAKERFVYHGQRAYDRQKLAVLQEERRASQNRLGGLLRDAVRGGSVSSSSVIEMAARNLTQLADDGDCKLQLAMQASRDPDIAEHCLKMSTLGMALGVELGLDEDNCQRIGVAGLIHDWGMGAVPEELWKSKRILTEHEMFQIRKHPAYTVDMLERMPGVPSIVPMVVYQVHEQPNGRGYPRGRPIDRIHLFARILAVADSYSALTSPRPHRAALTPHAAMECVVKLASRKVLDSEVVRALLKVLTLFPIGSYVALSDGQAARVIRRNGDQYATPFVQLIQDASGNPIAADRDDAVINLSTSDLTILQALPTPGRDECSLSVPILSQIRPRV